MSFKPGEKVIYFRVKHPPTRIEAAFVDSSGSRSRITVQEGETARTILVSTDCLERVKHVELPHCFTPEPGFRGAR